MTAPSRCRAALGMSRAGVFTSVRDLERKLLQYIKLYNKTCKPFRWTYDDPTRRIRAINN